MLIMGTQVSRRAYILLSNTTQWKVTSCCSLARRERRARVELRQSRTKWCRSPEGREGAYEVTLTYELRNTECSSYVLNRLKE